MMKLVLSSKLTKKKIPLNNTPIKPPSKHIHPVNSLLLDVVTKKPLKSCGCGK